MRNLAQAMWLRLSNLMRFAAPETKTSLRDKAIAVAERVSIAEDGKSWKVSCPVCLNVLMSSSHDSELRMTLAVHLSLWHPDDVKLQWQIMQEKNQSILHLPSLVIGLGIAVGFGALLSISAKNRHQMLHR